MIEIPKVTAKVEIVNGRANVTLKCEDKLGRDLEWCLVDAINRRLFSGPMIPALTNRLISQIESVAADELRRLAHEGLLYSSEPIPRRWDVP